MSDEMKKGGLDFSTKSIVSVWDESPVETPKRVPIIVIAREVFYKHPKVKEYVLSTYNGVEVDSRQSRRAIAGNMIRAAEAAAGRLDDVSVTAIMAAIDREMRTKHRCIIKRGELIGRQLPVTEE